MKTKKLFPIALLAAGDLNGPKVADFLASRGVRVTAALTEDGAA